MAQVLGHLAQLQSGPILGIAAIWGVNQQMQVSLLCPSLTLRYSAFQVSKSYIEREKKDLILWTKYHSGLCLDV